MESIEVKNHRQVINQYAVFKITGVIVNLVVWSYYYILLYKETGSFQILLTDYLVYYLGLFVGFVFITFYIDRLGYLQSFRITSLLQALTLLLIFFVSRDISSLYIILAIIRGFTHGLFWPIEHSINLKEVHGTERGRVISLIQSVILLLQIVIPVLAGALISYTGGYDYTFLVGAFLMFGSIFIPFSFNKKAKSKITTDEIQKILKKKGIGIYSIISILQSALNSLFVVLFMIIPYLIIGDEFGVGALTSVVGFAAVLTAWLDSKPSFKVRVRLGYLGFIIYSIFTVLLAYVWTIPALVIRSLALSFTQSVSSPAQTDIDYRIREKILGEFQNESALEMNLIVETLYIIGRIIMLGIIIIIFDILYSESEASAQDIIRLLVGILAPFHILIYLAYDIINRRLKVR